MTKYEQIQKCDKCEYSLKEGDKLYCDLDVCKYDKSFITFITSLLSIIIRFLLLISGAGLFMIGLLWSLKLFKINLNILITGIIFFIVIYAVYWFISWLIIRKGDK